MRSLVVLLVLLCAGASGAQTSYNLTSADSGIAQLAPRIEHRNATAYLAYIKVKVGANGDIMFATRPLGQQSFSAPVAITVTGTVNAGLQRGPEFAVAPDGTIHMVWMEQRFKANPDVFYSRGTENGTQWTEAIDISQDAQLATQDFPSIAVDSSGNVYVAWIDNREIIEGKSKNDHIYLTRSFDGGMTWGAPRKAENNPGGVGGSCECCRTAIAASADGDLYIAYRTNMANIRDIFVSRSNDKGETFDESIRVQTKEWMVHACPATGPMVALDARENLHVVYRSAANANKAAIFYNLLPKGLSRTFTEIPLSPVGGSSANYADIAVTPNGALNVVYQQSGLIYERISTNGGNSWSNAAKLDSLDAMQAFPIVGFDPAVGSLTTLWQDDRRDKNDILLAERAFAPEVTLPSLINLYYNRADSVDLIWSAAAPRQATWYIVGRMDTTIVTFDTVVRLSWSQVYTGATVIPMTSIGAGNTLQISGMGVSNAEPYEKLISNSYAEVGDELSIPCAHPGELTWRIYDALGSNHGILRSYSKGDSHSMQIPDLHSGGYFLRCEELSLNIRLLVRAR